jgi:hypothetical protein
LTFYYTSFILVIIIDRRLDMGLFGGLGKVLGGIVKVAAPALSFTGLGGLASPFASVIGNALADGKIDGKDVAGAAKSLIPGSGIISNIFRLS